MKVIQEALTDIIMGAAEVARRLFLILVLTVAWSAGYLWDCITYVLGGRES